MHLDKLLIGLGDLFLFFNIITIFLFEVNPKNMSKFAHQFQKRTDILPHLKEGLKCDALLVVGTKSSNLHAAEYMHSHMDKVRSIGCQKGFFVSIFSGSKYA